MKFKLNNVSYCLNKVWYSEYDFDENPLPEMIICNTNNALDTFIEYSGLDVITDETDDGLVILYLCENGIYESSTYFYKKNQKILDNILSKL